MTGEVLTARALNRATLERQLLLRRSPMPVRDAVDHLVGLQAQVPLNPYVALWSRLDRFDPAELAQLLVDRVVVRIVVMRGTLHLVTADDCLLLRPLVQPVLDGELARHSEYAASLVGVDIDSVLAFVRPILAERPLSGPQLRAVIAAEFPHLHAAALAYACRNRLAFVQVPPRGIWGKSGQVMSTTAEAWLGRPLVADPSIDDVVLRYLRAFGPASVADVAAWSRLTGFRAILHRLRPHLCTFRDERGRELFDLPEAPRPDPDTPAPPRFLPEYDNVLLSHADRTRFVDPRVVGHRWDALIVRGTVLADGLIAGTWHIDRDRNDERATLVVHHWPHLSKRSLQTIASEAKRFVRFHEDTAEAHDVRFVASAG
jgi:hypothetical protein